MEELPDETIARQVQNGDIKAFKTLVERYEPKMLRYAKRFVFGYEDAQDAVQDIFIKAYRNIKSFDTDRRFSPWIYRIAHNELINLIKKKGREPVSFFDPDTLFPHPATESTPQNDLEEKQLRQALDHLLGKLDPKYREPLILYHFENMDYQQIADIMHIPSSTVGIRLKRGRDQLRRLNESTPSL